MWLSDIDICFAVHGVHHAAGARLHPEEKLGACQLQYEELGAEVRCQQTCTMLLLLLLLHNVKWFSEINLPPKIWPSGLFPDDGHWLWAWRGRAECRSLHRAEVHWGQLDIDGDGDFGVDVDVDVDVDYIF